jgi:hypothetical protein
MSIESGSSPCLPAIDESKHVDVDVTIVPIERLENDNFFCERYKGSPVLLNQIQQDVDDIFVAVFRPMFARNVRKPEDIEDYLKDDIAILNQDLSKEEANVVLLREKQNNRIVGYSYSLPKSSQVVCVGGTAIHQEYRKQGGWSLMMHILENGIASGGYTTMVRCVNTTEGYLPKIVKRFSPGSVTIGRVINDYYGNSVDLSIDLKKNPLPRGV